MSSVKGIRESHRTRSLALSSQNRTRYPNARTSLKLRQPSSDAASSATPSASAKSRAVGDKLDLAEAIQLGREGGASDATSGNTSSGDEKTSGSSSDEDAYKPPARTMEVPLVHLPSTQRARRLSDDFVIVPHQQAIIALDSDDFLRSPQATTGRKRVPSTAIASGTAAARGDSAEDDWELVGDEEDFLRDSALKTKSWSKAVPA